MALQHASTSKYLLWPPAKSSCKTSSSLAGFATLPQGKRRHAKIAPTKMEHIRLSSQTFGYYNYRRSELKASRASENMGSIDGEAEQGEESKESDQDVPSSMTLEERLNLRRKIKEVIDMNPVVEEVTDPLEREKRIRKLVADYPLVVEEEDPDWTEEDDTGWGFKFGQFFDKITIKNKPKEEDDENYDSDNELVWEDDNYIRPIKDITAAQWEEAVFKDYSPLILLVHNRYRRPEENEKIRDALEKAVHIIWNCGLPSPRCVAIDAVVEHDLVSALKVSIFPEIIFTRAGQILYREKASRTADELSKIMAFFYFRAAKPPCLNGIKDRQEAIPSVVV